MPRVATATARLPKMPTRRSKAHALNGVFDGGDLRGGFGADRERSVGSFGAAGIADDVTKVVDLRGTERSCGIERDEQTRVAITTIARSRFGFDNADNFQAQFFGNDGEPAGGGFGCAG